MEEPSTKPSPWTKRSRQTQAAQWAGGLLFLGIGTTLGLSSLEPVALKWTLVITSLLGFLISLLWQSPKEREETENQDDLVDLARRAIQSEASRLDQKRTNLEKILMSYGEWMEFPDYQLLQTIDWKDQAHEEFDERTAALLDQEADEMLTRFSQGIYWTDGKFEGKQLLLDLVSFTESVARIYEPESELPLLELNLESLLKAVNRASIQIILMLEEIPVVEVQQMNLRKMSDNVRKASKVYRKYEELQPYLKPVRYLWQSSKLLLATNPLLAAGWIAGSEILWKGGKQLGKKAMDAYLLSLLRQTLGIIAWETAGIYDKTHRYRNPDWVYGVEIAHLLSQFDATQEVLREAFREIGRLPLKSTYDRLFLYRCIAQNASPKPQHFSQPELMSDELRKQLVEKLVEFYEKNISANAEAENEGTKKWRTEMEKRLLG